MNAERKAAMQDRFKRVFPERLLKLNKSIQLLRNCSNKANYQFELDDVVYKGRDVKAMILMFVRAIQELAEGFGLDVEFKLNEPEEEVA